MIHDIQRRTSHHVLDMLVSDDELIIQRMTVRAASLLHRSVFLVKRDNIHSLITFSFPTVVILHAYINFYFSC